MYPKKSSIEVKEKKTQSRYSKENLTFHYHQSVVLHPGCMYESPRGLSRNSHAWGAAQTLAAFNNLTGDLTV